MKVRILIGFRLMCWICFFRFHLWQYPHICIFNSISSSVFPLICSMVFNPYLHHSNMLLGSYIILQKSSYVAVLYKSSLNHTMKQFAITSMTLLLSSIDFIMLSIIVSVDVMVCSSWIDMVWHVNIIQDRCQVFSVA